MGGGGRQAQLTSLCGPLGKAGSKARLDIPAFLAPHLKLPSRRCRGGRSPLMLPERLGVFCRREEQERGEGGRSFVATRDHRDKASITRLPKRNAAVPGQAACLQRAAGSHSRCRAAVRTGVWAGPQAWGWQPSWLQPHPPACPAGRPGWGPAHREEDGGCQQARGG